jgi:thiol-disulfide isomerase/thioredoxin
MKIKALLLVTVMLLTLSAYSQTGPEPAKDVLAKAFKQAGKEKKNVMLIFHASWCGWCKKMEASLKDSTCRDYFNRSYVITELTILESKDKAQLENPGAIDIFNENGGKGGGIPFFLIYDKKGNILADSRMKETDGKLANIGCPAAPEEVAAFVDILKKTSKISESEIAAVTERFKKNKAGGH